MDQRERKTGEKGSAVYEVRVKGHVQTGHSDLFENLEIILTHDSAGDPVTVLTGQLVDQSMLHGVLARIRDLAIPLVSVRKVPEAEPPASTGPTPALSPARLRSLADGVFTVAMTLLVLELVLPPGIGRGTDPLGVRLIQMWPQFFFCIMSFLVLGIYWLIHHSIFAVVTKYDSTLVWLNIFYLLPVVMVPFMTSLYREFGTTRTTCILYGANQLLIFLLGFAIWCYVTSGRRLVIPELETSVIRGGKQMGAIYFSVMVVGIALAFVSPLASTILYTGIVVVFIVITLIGNPETVMIVQQRRANGKPHTSPLGNGG